MQIREQHQAGAQVRVLAGLRLFDLHHQVAGGPQRGRGGHDLRTGLRVLIVGQGTAHARARLDQHAMPRLDERLRAARQQAHAGFVILNFCGDSDDHLAVPVRFYGPAVMPEVPAGVVEDGPLAGSPDTKSPAAPEAPAFEAGVLRAAPFEGFAANSRRGPSPRAISESELILPSSSIFCSLWNCFSASAESGPHMPSTGPLK